MYMLLSMLEKEINSFSMITGSHQPPTSTSPPPPSIMPLPNNTFYSSRVGGVSATNNVTNSHWNNHSSVNGTGTMVFNNDLKSEEDVSDFDPFTCIKHKK